MQWQLLPFSALTTHQLYDVLMLRVAVFVVEQACAYPELDNKDRLPETLHLLGCDAAGQLLAYARILPPGSRYAEASIGRVLVAQSARGQGVASLLMDKAIAACKQQWPTMAISIGAQEYLQAFYQSKGFQPVSAVYLEDGIPHLDMLLATA